MKWFYWIHSWILNLSLSDRRPPSHSRAVGDVCLSSPWCHTVQPCCKYLKKNVLSWNPLSITNAAPCIVSIKGELTLTQFHGLTRQTQRLFSPSPQDIFVSLSQVDGLYFVCNIDDFKFLADMIQHIPLNLRSRYVFCTAPINKKQAFVCTSVLKVSRSRGERRPS